MARLSKLIACFCMPCHARIPHVRLLVRHWAGCTIQVGADVAALAAALRKPLRPLWVSQNSLIWLDRVPDVADLGFTPLLLVSASLPNARQRRIAGEPKPLKP